MKTIRQIVYPIKIGLVSLLCAGLIGCNKGKRAVNNEETLNPKDTSPLIETITQDEKPDTTSVIAIITDAHGNKYNLSQCSIDASSIGNFGITVATIEKDEIYYLCDFTKIDKIDHLKDGQEKVYLRNSKQIAENWVPNDRPSNFYRDENNPLQTGHIYGLFEGNISRIRIDDIEQIIFNEVKQPKTKETQKSPKKIELKDGTTFTTDFGYIADFCGHWWRSTYHPRLQDYCQVMNGKTIKLEDLTEIEFTGNFDERNPQCREVILRYKSGKEEKESLFLTSESYGGVDNSGFRFRNFDKMFAIQDYGAVLIPLDKIKKIIPL